MAYKLISCDGQDGLPNASVGVKYVGTTYDVIRASIGGQGIFANSVDALHTLRIEDIYIQDIHVIIETRNSIYTFEIC